MSLITDEYSWVVYVSDVLISLEGIYLDPPETPSSARSPDHNYLIHTEAYTVVGFSHLSPPPGFMVFGF